MLMRLAALCLALHRKKVSQTNITQPSEDPGVEKSEDDAIGELFSEEYKLKLGPTEKN